MPLQVIGLRHGEVHNPEGVVYAGLPGYGLSEAGRTQAAEMAGALDGLPVVAVYASPLDRAMETATYIANATGVEVTPDIRLHEWRHWQQWAGMTWEDLREKARESWEAYLSDPASVTSGESLAELGERMDAWLADVLRDHKGGIVIGVTHLEPLRTVLLRSLARPAKDMFEVQIGVGKATRIRPEADVTPLDGHALREVLTALV